MTREQLQTWLTDPHRRPMLMGVLNVTPDSFSDGGRHLDPAAAVEAARSMADAGASLIDIGAESTRPGAQPVPAREQIARLLPILQALHRHPPPAGVSIDTTQAAVADIALDLGVLFINDVSAGRDDPDLLPLLARRKCPVCLMHMQGTPRTMQRNPSYGDVVSEVKEFLSNRVRSAVDAGIPAANIVIDPGIGFGKTLEHNLALLNRLDEFRALGQPILIGTSRKGFIGQVTGVADPASRQFGTAATVCWSAANGADIIRVHDVPQMAQVLRMTMAMKLARLQ